MGVVHERRAELIAAAIAEIGETGTLEVSVGRIAKRAGVSQALAFHYFGDKENLFLAAMREIMRLFSRDTADRLARAKGMRARLDAVICACFSEANFRHGVAAAWLNFYTLAFRSDEARRLLTVYHRRLHANLVHDLRPIAGESAVLIARRLAALIDGLFLRYAHAPSSDAGSAGIAHLRTALDLELNALA